MFNCPTELPMSCSQDVSPYSLAGLILRWCVDNDILPSTIDS